MGAKDLVTLLHPAIAIVFVFPLLGIVTHYAWQTRQRRLAEKNTKKSKLPAAVGLEHLRFGQWLTGAIVGLVLLGLAQAIGKKMVTAQTWNQEPLRVGFVVTMFALTIASLVMLYLAKTRSWRAAFATLTGMGLVLLGCQPEVFRRSFEWYLSHYYIGMAAAMLMIFALAIVPEIYRSQTWRRVHIALNVIALLLFVGQAMTGTRDLLEIPLSWQEQFIYQCNFENLTCPAPAPAPPQSLLPSSVLFL